MRALSFVLLLALTACGSTHEPGWTGTSDTPFDNAKARCQIETQTVDGPDWERCMAAAGWRRLP